MNYPEKRKVIDTSFENLEDGEEAFQRSKITARSPESKDKNMEDRIIQAIQKLKEDMKAGFANCREQNEELKNELMEKLGKTNEELKQIKQEMKENEKIGKREKQDLEEKLGVMEKRIERQEKEQRKNNIIIKGAEIKGPDLKGKVENFLENQIGVKTSIPEAYSIGVRMTLVKIQSWDDKMAIMKKKQNLKGTNTFIENDLTKQEREIQKTLRDIAKKEKEKGNVVRIAYKKITINNKIYQWNEREKGIREREENQGGNNNAKN